MSWSHQDAADLALGRLVREQLRKEAERIVDTTDGDYESLEAFDAEDVVADRWDDGWAWDTLSAALIEEVEECRDGKLADLIDHAVEDAELRRALGGRR